MNERNIVIVGVFLLIGLSFFSYLDGFSGFALMKQNQQCTYVGGSSASIFEPQQVIYDTKSGVPPKTYKSACAAETSLTAVRCLDNARPAKYVVDCPTDYVCVDSIEGAYCTKGTVESETSSSCVDSDAQYYGRDIFYVGHVNKVGEVGGNRVTEYWDRCAVSNDRFGDTVTEYSCKTDGSVTNRIEQCPNGYKCSNGACVNK